jgi:hypothetical protein
MSTPDKTFFTEVARFKTGGVSRYELMQSFLNLRIDPDQISNAELQILDWMKSVNVFKVIQEELLYAIAYGSLSDEDKFYKVCLLTQVFFRQS